MTYILKTDESPSPLQTDAALSLIYDLTAAMVSQDYQKAEEIISTLNKLVVGGSNA